MLCLLLLLWYIFIWSDCTPHTWFEWTIQQAEFFWLEQHSSEENKRPSGYVGFPVFTSGTTGQYLNNKGVDPNTWPELSRRFARVQRRYVPLVSRKLLAFSPLFSSAFLVPVDPPENSFKNRKLHFQQQIAWVEITCIFVQQVVRVLIIWSIGFFIWSYFGASRWCYYKLKYCENYASKQWCELHIKLPRYCYVMYNLRKSNLWGTLDFRCSPSRCTAR